MILGIDIGINGAIAFLKEDGSLIRIEDMPTLGDGPKHRRAVNASLVALIVAKARISANEQGRAYIELVGPMPKQGVSSVFSFGRSRGVVEGVLAGLCVPVTFLTPVTWRKLVGLGTRKSEGKDSSRSEAIRRWPSQAGLFAKVRDDGRAEAALIATAGLFSEHSDFFSAKRV